MDETKITNAGSIRDGSFILIDGVACKVIETQTSKSGKHGHAKMRILAMGLLDNKKRDIVMPAHNNVEVPIIDKRVAQVLSVVGDKANVMDSESFETFDMDIPEEMKGKLVEGVQVMYWIVTGQKIMKQIKGSGE